jgi:hypothetical protein
MLVELIACAAAVTAQHQSSFPPLGVRETLDVLSVLLRDAQFRTPFPPKLVADLEVTVNSSDPKLDNTGPRQLFRDWEPRDSEDVGGGMLSTSLAATALFFAARDAKDGKPQFVEPGIIRPSASDTTLNDDPFSASDWPWVRARDGKLRLAPTEWAPLLVSTEIRTVAQYMKAWEQRAVVTPKWPPIPLSDGHDAADVLANSAELSPADAMLAMTAVNRHVDSDWIISAKYAGQLGSIINRVRWDISLEAAEKAFAASDKQFDHNPFSKNPGPSPSAVALFFAAWDARLKRPQVVQAEAGLLPESGKMGPPQALWPWNVQADGRLGLSPIRLAGVFVPHPYWGVRSYFVAWRSRHEISRAGGDSSFPQS